MGVGARVAAARRGKGLSQEGLARAAEVSLSTVQRLEARDAVPTVPLLKRIAGALDQGVGALLDEDAA